MPITLKEIQDGPALLELVEKLRAEVAELKTGGTHRIGLPTDKLIQSEANKLFIGRGGKPVDRHTFLRMIKSWQEEGVLVLNKNLFETGGMRFISIDFLKGVLPQQPQKKLKRA